MAIKTSSGFDIGVREPIDLRTVVNNYHDLTNIKTTFDGLECWVVSSQQKYRFQQGEWKLDSGGDVDSISHGIIAMWSGAVDAIPLGWQLCDGTNDTLDLRDRFIVGSGARHQVGDIGDSVSATLTDDDLSTGPGAATDENSVDLVPSYYSLAFIMHMQGSGEGGYIDIDKKVNEAIEIAEKLTNNMFDWEIIE